MVIDMSTPGCFSVSVNDYVCLRFAAQVICDISAVYFRIVSFISCWFPFIYVGHKRVDIFVPPNNSVSVYAPSEISSDKNMS